MAATAGKTLIKGGWIVAFDGKEHRILRDGVVVFEGDTIVHVGKSYDGKVGETIDASDHLVLPGFVNSHCHVSTMLGDRMVLEAGRRDAFRSGFLSYVPTLGPTGPSIGRFEDALATVKYSLASMLRHGSTTLVEIGSELAGDATLLMETAAELGVRLYTSPGYASGTHVRNDAGQHQLYWDEKAGMEGLDRAVAFIRKHDNSYDGLFRGILVPLECWLSTPDLLKRTKEAAKELGVPITTHVSESVAEFHETVRRTGRSPVAVLRDLEFLGPEVILGHCVYFAGHSATAYSRYYNDDLDAIAEAGATVAHCPLTFARRGVILESFQRYMDSGVNLGIGTDSYPQDMISEMNFVSVLGKVADGTFDVAKSRDVFNAATLGGARALGRDDLGRLSKGAKADIVIADLDALRMGPFVDPVKALVHAGNGNIIDTVIVNGKVLLEDGRLKLWDEKTLVRDARKSAANVWNHFNEFHYNDQPMSQAYPGAFRDWEG